MTCSCEVCSKIWGLLCFHAKYCATALGGHCPVAQCDYLRNKIALKQRQDAMELLAAKEMLVAEGEQVDIEKQEMPVERRMAAAEEARRETLAMIEAIRRQRASTFS